MLVEREGRRGKRRRGKGRCVHVYTMGREITAQACVSPVPGEFVGSSFL